MIETDLALRALHSKKCPGVSAPERGCLDGPDSMTNFDVDAFERHGSSIDLDRRDARALTEYMTVLEEGGDYTVVGQNGGTYTVDGRKKRCTCPDYEHNLPDGDRENCKHIARVNFATGGRPIPGWVEPDAVDEQLGLHTDTPTQVATTDGGIIEAGDQGEVLDDGDIDRPDDCQCWDPEQGLPCWPCYRDGYEQANPGAGE
jgi:hypothetical protein